MKPPNVIEVPCPACGDLLSADISIDYDTDKSSDGLTVTLSANVDEQKFTADIHAHLRDKHPSMQVSA